MMRRHNGDDGVPNRALIIDDEKFTLELFEYELKSQGFDVTTASSGTDGIEKLKKQDVML